MTKSAKMIDRVAGAIAEAIADPSLHDEPDMLFSGNANAHLNCRNIARAAIASMREPTEPMVDAGMKNGASWESEREDFRESWRAQIDAALK